MFRIRRIHDDLLPANREAVLKAQSILRAQFPGLAPEEIEQFPLKVRNHARGPMRPMLYIAEGARERIRGFAMLYYCRALNFCYLNYLATAAGASNGATGGGVGGALYERLREEAEALGAIGLFYECLPDDPAVVANPEHLAQNKARLKFYERYGARPIAGTAYETPPIEGRGPGPYLVFDDLGSGRPLRRDDARAIVRTILAEFYPVLCGPDYVRAVVESFKDDPVALRPLRYSRRPAAAGPPPCVAHKDKDRQIVLVVNDRHEIHHVRDYGYVEAPVRIRSILDELARTPFFERIEPRRFSDKYIRAVHDGGFVNYLRRVCEGIGTQKSIYPYVFPIRNAARPPEDLAMRAGYYCIDTFTPLNGNAYIAAARAVDCALTAAQAVERGRRLAYALVRPPGHHAERRSFGGFCYFNSSAIAANYLSSLGRVAILDIDYHHGNGQQDIFYNRADVLTISIHGHPRFAYPYFSGFEEERGSGAGVGSNFNYPLPEKQDGAQYRETLARALRQVRRFDPMALVVAFGLDPARHDPTGTWSLAANDFEMNGAMIGELGLPTLVVQEGGYRTRTLGVNARRFFTGLLEGSRKSELEQEKTNGKTVRL